MKLFNLPTEQYISILETRLTLDTLFLLELVVNKENVNIDNSRIQGFLQTLRRRGYLNEENVITKAGEELYTSLTIARAIIKTKKVGDVKQAMSSLHNKLEARILELTGRKQVRVEILGKKYSFLPNEIDLMERLNKVIKKYKLTDMEKLEHTLIRYIEGCHKRNKWYPLLVYYITKDDQSRLVTDMKSLEDKPQATAKAKDFEI